MVQGRLSIVLDETLMACNRYKARMLYIIILAVSCRDASVWEGNAYTDVRIFGDS